MHEAKLSDAGQTAMGQIFPDFKIPLRHPNIMMVELEGYEEETGVYMVDWLRLSELEQMELKEWLMDTREDAPKAFAEQLDLLDNCIPIRADHVSHVITDVLHHAWGDDK